MSQVSPFGSLVPLAETLTGPASQKLGPLVACPAVESPNTALSSPDIFGCLDVGTSGFRCLTVVRAANGCQPGVIGSK